MAVAAVFQEAFDQSQQGQAGSSAVYDQHRSRAVRQALAALAKRGCFCAGRYGKWEYSFMESSLLEGLALAEKLV